MELAKIFEMICKLRKLGHSFIHKYLMIPDYVPYGGDVDGQVPKGHISMLRHLDFVLRATQNHGGFQAFYFLKNIFY